MKLGYTIIYVSDVLKTIEFYKQAFSLEVKSLHDSNQYAEMQTGETTLAFASEGLAESNEVRFKPNRATEIAAGFEIAFVTDNVNTAFKIAIKAGASPIAPPKKKPWGQTIAYVKDINGVLVEICDPE